MGDELFPEKNGEILTTDIDYVDVWKVMQSKTLTPGFTDKAWDKSQTKMNVWPVLTGNNLPLNILKCVIAIV